MLRDELLAAYDLFSEGCHAGCRSPDDMTEREHAGMLLSLFGPEAVDAIDDVGETVRDLVLEGVKGLPSCSHASCKPKRGFDPVAAETMLPHKVRNAFPPFMGHCPDCGYQVVVYVSEAHAIASEDYPGMGEDDS